MPRIKVPEGDLVHFIVKTRYYASQTTEFEKNLGRIRNLANRMFRDHVGYTFSGDHRLKEKGEAIFAASVARDRGRRARPSRVPGVKSHLRHLGDGAFLWQGTRTLVLGIPPALRTVDKVDFLLADRFSPALREPLLELLRSTGATLIAPPEVAAEAALRGLPASEIHLGGSIESDSLAVYAVTAINTEELAPIGYVVEMDGCVLYHAGRTALTSDMVLVGDLFHVDVMTLRLGARLPLSLWAAARAVEWTGAHWVLPWTAESVVFPKDLQKHLGDAARVKLLAPNEEWEVGQ